MLMNGIFCIPIREQLIKIICQVLLGSRDLAQLEVILCYSLKHYHTIPIYIMCKRDIELLKK